MRPGLKPRIHRELIRLTLDVVAGEIVAALRADGIPSILLKGPAIATWLYQPGEERAYGDVDLLVPRGDLRRARARLEAVGFAYLNLDVGTGRDSHHDRLLRDGIRVELHRTLVGVGVDADALWRTLAAHTEPMMAGNQSVDVLTPPARALVVALHAAQHGAHGAPLRDLERALERVPAATWEAAIALAAVVDALPEFATGLRLCPPGAALAAERRLPEPRDVFTRLRAAAAHPAAASFEVLRTSGWRGRLEFLARTLTLPPDAMRARHPLARRGRVSLAAAYLLRPIWLLARAPPAFRACLRAAREHQSRDT